MQDVGGVRVTRETCAAVPGPFFHGTAAILTPGDLLLTGMPSNFDPGRISRHLYFSATIDAAAWGAEIASALSGSTGRGHVYVVEPLGPFEDDPNLTDKRFPGNPTRSYRTAEPLRVVGTVDDWEGHPADVLKTMLDSLAAMARDGRLAIED